MVGLHYERGRQRVNDGFINMVVHTDQGDQITLSDDVGDIVPHRLFVGQVRKYSLRVAHTMEEIFGETLRVSKVAVSVVNGSERKSTRLNSSHVATSYAVFCVKK